MTEVVEVASRRDLGDFIRLPLSLYREDPLYVPPLLSEMRKHLSDRNPFFRHAAVRFFVARKKGQPCGRIASIVNESHLRTHREKAGFFGFFESIDDDEVAAALLGKAAGVLSASGMKIMRGPMSFSTNEECGFLVHGFDSSPMLMMPYNPPYYPSLMERYGMQKIKDLFAYIIETPSGLPSKIERVAAAAERSGVTVRPIDKKKFDVEMKIFRNIYNAAWKENWGFIPLTEEETSHLAASLRPVAVPDMTLIAEKKGEPIGFMGLLPDFNYVLKRMRGKTNPISIAKGLYYSRKIADLRLLLLGIRPEYRNRGVDALLFREGFKGVRRGGYRRVEFSWILEDNIPVQRLVEMIGGRLYKRYRVYEKAI